MKKLNSVLERVVLCVCEVLLGVLLLFDPIGFTTGIIKAGGILLILTGIYALIGYFRTSPEEAQMGQGLVKAVIALLGGLFCLFNSEWFIVTFPLLTIMYGLVILLTGIMRIQWAVDMLRMKRERWYLGAVSAVLSLIFAGLILYNPFTSTAFLWTFVAVSLIVEAVADLIVLIFAAGSIEKGQEQEKQ